MNKQFRKLISIKNTKSKIILFISFVCILITAASVFYLNNNTHSNPANSKQIMDPIFDSKIDSNAKFIDSNSSKYFNYTAKAMVDNSKITNDLVQLQYIIEITPKTSSTYSDVVATVFLNNNMHNWIVSSSILYFGVSKSNKITISPKHSTGIVIEKTTWIKKVYNKSKLEKDLELPIKIKVSWKGNTEYAIISNVDVTFK